MSAAEFDTQFNRLTAHFHMPVDASRETVALDWYRAVEHYHVDAMDRAVTEMIRAAEDRFWPPLGTLLTAIRTRIDKYDKTHGKCATCNGSTWIESWPMKTRENRVYEFLQRCPDCGVPAPEIQKDARHLTPLTKDKYARFKSGQWEHPPMPPGLDAKPRPAGEQTEMRAAMERLRIKLFGAQTEDGAA